MFGCAVVLASDASFARARGRASSAPPPKPSAAAANPAKQSMSPLSKPANAQQQKAGASEPQKPFAAAPRPERSTFININPRPFGSAPANTSPQRAMHESAEGFGPLRHDPDLEHATENARMAESAATTERGLKEAEAGSATLATKEPPSRPLTSSLRVAVPWAPAASDKPEPASPPMICYVQRSGACLPF
jgi:hypothetical protein